MCKDGNHSVVYFNRISQKVIDKDELQDLQEFIGETMAHLEMCFPLGFFDIIEHIMIHIIKSDMGTWSTLPIQNVDV